MDPVEEAQVYGPDALRYFLLRHTPAAEDSDYSPTRLELAHNSELADQLGNLLSRTVSMVTKYYDGIVPAPGGRRAARRLADLAMVGRAGTGRDGRSALHEALAAIWELIGAANKYVVEVAPWALAKARAPGSEAGARLATALYTLIEALRLAALSASRSSRPRRSVSRRSWDCRRRARWLTAVGRVCAGQTCSPAQRFSRRSG